jgi:putative transposase
MFFCTSTKDSFSRCKPEIMNSDQGPHFTNADYLELLEKEGIQVSMDGKGRATDNCRTERPHQSLNGAKPDQFYDHIIEQIAS